MLHLMSARAKLVMLLVLETIANGAAMLVAHPHFTVRIRISPFFSKASSRCVRSSNTLREALPLLYTRRVGVGAESGDGGELYTVAAIRGKQVVSNAERGGMYEVYYEVQWEGFDEKTWESADSLSSTGDAAVKAMIADFEAKDREKKGGVLGSLMKSTQNMAAAYGEKLNPVVGPKAFERNLKATEEWSKEMGGKAKNILDNTDSIFVKKEKND